MVFAVRVTEGVKDHEDCPSLSAKNERRLEEYMQLFKFDV